MAQQSKFSSLGQRPPPTKKAPQSRVPKKRDLGSFFTGRSPQSKLPARPGVGSHNYVFGSLGQDRPLNLSTLDGNLGWAGAVHQPFQLPSKYQSIDPDFAFTPGPQSIDSGFANSSAQREGFNESNYISKEFGSPGLFPTDPSATSPAKDQFIANKTRDITNPAFQETSTGKPTTDQVLQTIADFDPEAADKAMDILGYTGNTASRTSVPTGGTTPSGVTVNADGTYTEPPKSATDKAFDTYLNSLKPSSELKTARKELAAFDTRAALDYERALETGETLGSARGRAALTARQNAILRGGAAASVSALAGLDERRGEIGKARFEYEQAKLDKNKPFELSPGQKRFDFDPVTGEYKEIASVDPKAAAPRQSITTVNGRRVLIDLDQQKIIKDFGPSTDSKDEDPEMVLALQGAQAAINDGADKKAVRQRFLENYPNKGTLYNNYMGGQGVTFAVPDIAGAVPDIAG